MPLIARIIGKPFGLQALQGSVILLFKLSHFALGKKEPFFLRIPILAV